MAHQVCIIGAGVSGLRCATVLLSHGFEVTIIEARNRVGGRIAQSDLMGKLPVDIGANWVHSTGVNPIVELAKETGTPLHLWKQNTLMIDSTGRLVPTRSANETLDRVWNILEKAVGYSTANTGEIDASQSLYDFFAQESGAMVHSHEINDRERTLLLQMATMWGAYVGDRVERQSLKFMFLEDCIGGDDCFIPTNYKEIVSRIAAIPLNKARMELGTVMTSIVYNRGESRKVSVTTLDGKERMFDEVVVTTPLGWLKSHENAIRPLEPRVSQAIEAMSFGRLEKVLIEFPSSFWDAPNEDRAADPVSFIHWLSPAYAPTTNPRNWRLECVSFNAFPAPYRRNILLFYTYGDCSTHITTMIRGLEGQVRADKLQEFFEPYYSRLPTYDPQTCYGSYSNFQVGMGDAANDVKAIRHGMPQHHIYFAGEHTAPFDGLGTVAGAYNSGEKVAERIIASRRGHS